MRRGNDVSFSENDWFGPCGMFPGKILAGKVDCCRGMRIGANWPFIMMAGDLLLLSGGFVLELCPFCTLVSCMGYIAVCAECPGVCARAVSPGVKIGRPGRLPCASLVGVA